MSDKCRYCADTGVVELRAKEKTKLGSGYAFGCCCPMSDLPVNISLPKWNGHKEMVHHDVVYVYDFYDLLTGSGQ